MAIPGIYFVILIIPFVSFVHGASCPDGWTSHQQSCYIFLKETYNWFNAKSACDTLGGYLVEIETEEENQFLAGLVHTHGDPHSWIGLEDFLEEGIFVWATTRERPEVTHWQAGEPDDVSGHEDCAGILGSGLWFDGSCELDHRPFICEMQVKEGSIIGRR